MSLAVMARELSELGSPPEVRASNVSSQPETSQKENVLSFPADPADGSMPKVALRMVLMGNTPRDIAKVTGYTEEAVLKIAESEWAKKELDKIATESETPQSSVRNLIRLAAFPAGVRLRQLIDSPNHMVALGACKVVLEYSIANVKVDDLRDKSKTTDKDAKTEHAELTARIASLESQLKRKTP